MFSATGPPEIWRGEACVTRPGSASQTEKSKILLEKVVSAGRKQKSTAPAGLFFATFFSRDRLVLSFSMLASHWSMVRKDDTVRPEAAGAVSWFPKRQKTGVAGFAVGWAGPARRRWRRQSWGVAR